jgi:hypothetical protein
MLKTIIPWTLNSINKTAGCGSVCLLSQHSGSEGRRIKSSRPAWLCSETLSQTNQNKANKNNKTIRLCDQYFVYSTQYC